MASKARPTDPTALKRESAGTYRSGDGRFSVEQASGRWLLIDAEQHDDLGLPLVRGPYETLVAAKAVMAEARTEPAPSSDLATRPRPAPSRLPDRRGTPGGRAGTAATSAPRPRTPAPAAEPPPIEVRRLRRGDGEPLRALWREAGFRSIGDDDDSLERMAERNPGLVLVALEGARLVGSALGAWDGRRGWIYHVATAADHRRAGLATRLVREVERKLRQLGCLRVNVVVHDENPAGADFWEALGYASPPSRLWGKDL